jgi:MFS family permease
MQAAATGERRRPSATTIAAITIGNGLEFFDFTVYSFFAVLIGKLFFPGGSEIDSLMLAVGTFGISFFARPIGGVVLGMLADHRGRKPAMTLTLLLMALGSLGVACAPTYAQVGVLAPVWLVAARLIQGFALGGEVGASTALLMEYANDNNRGWWGSWQYFSQGVSSLCGALLATFLSRTLSPDDLAAWGWRIPFAIGVLMVPVGVYIRRHLEETLGARPERKRSAYRELGALLADHWGKVRDGMLFIVGATIGTYLVVFYISVFATQFLKMPMSVSLFAGVTASLVIVVVSPIAGTLSDRFGRRALIGWPRLLLMILAVPGFMLLQASPTLPTLIGVVAVLATLLTLSANVSIVMITEMLPRPVRATSLSIIYSLGVAIFGGTAQLIATWLIKVTDSQLAPAWYMVGANLISLIPLLYIKETAGKPA